MEPTMAHRLDHDLARTMRAEGLDVDAALLYLARILASKNGPLCDRDAAIVRAAAKHADKRTARATLADLDRDAYTLRDLAHAVGGRMEHGTDDDAALASRLLTRADSGMAWAAEGTDSPALMRRRCAAVAVMDNDRPNAPAGYVEIQRDDDHPDVFATDEDAARWVAPESAIEVDGAWYVPHAIAVAKLGLATVDGAK